MNLHVTYRFLGFFIFELGLVLLHLCNKDLTQSYKEIIVGLRFKTEEEKVSMYYYIRYPIFSALLTMIGSGILLTGLLLTELLCIILTTIVSIVFSLKMDKELSNTYGDDFIFNKSNTGALFPKFWKW